MSDIGEKNSFRLALYKKGFFCYKDSRYEPQKNIENEK